MDHSDFDFSDFSSDTSDCNPNHGPLYEPPKWRMILGIMVLIATTLYAIFELGSYIYGML
jgi:hypothetical protein